MSTQASPRGVAGSTEEINALAGRLLDAWEELNDSERRRLVERIREAATARIGRPPGAPELVIVPDVTDDIDGTAWLLAHLTAREWEVLRELAAGRSTTGIARRLGIAPGTTRNHVKSVLVKLGVHSRLEAVALFINR